MLALHGNLYELEANHESNDAPAQCRYLVAIRHFNKATYYLYYFRKLGHLESGNMFVGYNRLFNNVKHSSPPLNKQIHARTICKICVYPYAEQIK